MSVTAEDSRDVLPRFPLDMLDVEAPPSSARARSAASGRRQRTHLELVPETSEPNVLAAAALHDLFNGMDDESSVALTQVYVPISEGIPGDRESRGRLDEFWSTIPLAVPEPPAVYLPLFPRVPLLQRPMVVAALLGVTAVAVAALWISIFALMQFR